MSAPWTPAVSPLITRLPPMNTFALPANVSEKRYSPRRL
jgi:hypothetical protein